MAKKPPPQTKLTPQQEAFCEEYAKDLNGTQAARRASYSAHTASEQAARLLGKAIVQKKIAELRAARSERTAITSDAVLSHWWAIVRADPNNLVQHRRAPCRHCNGTDGLFQWKTRREFDEAMASAVKREKDLPSDAGGYGYSHAEPINPRCGECFGEGVGYTYAADTRHLTAEQRLLYAGVKQTKDGLEIKLHDQGRAMENVARHLGMFNDKLIVTDARDFAAKLGAARARATKRG